MSGNEAELLKIHGEFTSLLDQKLEEQRYQQYIEANTQLIPREFVQNHGVHLSLVLRKLSLAKDYTCDFFYLSKSSRDWNLVFVELEKPQSRYFLDGCNDVHPNLISGVEQIGRWRAWFDVPANKLAFIDHTISPLLVPIGMRRNPCNVRFVLVHGRRAEFEGNEMRQRLISNWEKPDMRIISYDSLLEGINHKKGLYLAVRKNEHIDIASNKFLDEMMFSHMAPTHLRISDEFRADAIAKRGKWFHLRDEDRLVMDEALPKVGRC